MEKKYLYSVHFEESDFQDLNCVFDTYQKAKEAVQTIFDKVSAVNPAWQNLMLDDEEAENEWAVYSFDYIGEDAKFLLKPNIGITVFSVPYNSLPID